VKLLEIGQQTELAKLAWLAKTMLLWVLQVNDEARPLHSLRNWPTAVSMVGIELRRAGCRWGVTKPALSIASWVLISTMATFSKAFL
jgi:hypothetical protein